MSRLFARRRVAGSDPRVTQLLDLQDRLLEDAFTERGRSLDWQADAQTYLEQVQDLNEYPPASVTGREARLLESGHALLTGWLRGRLF